MDVHDVGEYRFGEAWRVLEPGMVLTIEPGLYFPADLPETPPELAGIGIRIEDDVLVTASGYEVLTEAAPRDGDAIEALMAEAGRESRLRRPLRWRSLARALWAAPSPWPWITPGFPWCCSIRDRPRGRPRPRRGVALAPDVLAFLAGLGVGVPQTPYEHMTVWDHTRAGGPTFFCGGGGASSPWGHGGKRPAALGAYADAARGVPLRWGTRVARFAGQASGRPRSR